jgi:hypothetical protein
MYTAKFIKEQSQLILPFGGNRRINGALSLSGTKGLTMFFYAGRRRTTPPSSPPISSISIRQATPGILF